MNARHLSQSAERYTPGYIIDPGRETLGGFDLDPASCAKANEIVQAVEFYTAEDDGLAWLWEGRLLANPPGTCKVLVDRIRVGATRDGQVEYRDVFAFPGCGDKLPNGKARKTCSCGYVKRFWEKLLLYVDEGDVFAAIWIGFNCSQLQTLQQCEASPLDFLTCFIDHRVPYLDQNLKPLSSPPHNSYVTLVAPPGSEYELRFVKNYGHLGAITRRIQ